MSSSSSSSSSTLLSSPAVDVDPAVWMAVAGSSVQIPAVNSYVYYFPQGHLDTHSTITNTNSAITALQQQSCPFIPCQVVSVRYLSTTPLDYIFAKITLQPIHPLHQRRSNATNHQQDDEGVVSFAKKLTSSDSNNGGGFSVPRSCADSIFPRLNFEANPPVQTLAMHDTLGNAWQFRHIFRGTPRRHLLTTGWGRFVNNKRLVEGDSVLFMSRKSTDELFIGVRRAAPPRSGAEDDQVVVEAIGNAARGARFEVVYCPRVGSSHDFVVSTEKVENATRMIWRAGMRVKVAVETEDSSRMTCYQGTVVRVELPDSGPWRGSPWRMLQVTWDEPGSLKNMNRVSPWQVEYVSLTPDLHSIPPPKRLRLLQNMEMPPIQFSMTQMLANSMGGRQDHHPSPSPASMQGARPDPIRTPTYSNSHNIDNPCPTYTQLLKNGVETESRTVSTVLNIGTPSSEDLSPVSQDNAYFRGEDLAHQQGPSSLSRVVWTSFHLFGQPIVVPRPVEDGHKSTDIGLCGERKNVHEQEKGCGQGKEGLTRPPQLTFSGEV